MTGSRIDVVSDIRGLAALRDDWNDLAAGGNPLLRHECAMAFTEAYGRLYEPRAVVLRDGSGVRAIAPLAAPRLTGSSTLHLMGQPLHEPASLLYRDGAALEELLAALVGWRRPFLLHRLPADRPETGLLQAGPPRLTRCFTRTGLDSAWVPLGMPWAGFEAAMASRHRSAVRRKWKVAESRGAVEFEALAPDEARAEAVLRAFFRIEHSGWKRRDGTSILSNPPMERFFLLYGRAVARLGMLRIFFLKIGGETVAGRVAVEHGRTLWELKIGYDERWSECSPGILLTHATLRYGCENGLAAHEFLGVLERWENLWSPRLHRYNALRVYPATLRGGVSFACDLTEVAVRRSRIRAAAACRTALDRLSAAWPGARPGARFAPMEPREER
ncbi:CelD/BcsL family acetyltransferase involved in cellulose biosynthesis [Azospirillum agricola]|uniref:GNAT family N-acetyltransferase n=1 Tax=Azospirillum agricola TaxID=1720247 RepID=UPI001AE14521|nr:GNAT family N-acetyltransferase [Azospirillum agricola]MBP2227748.1 CelD/BcsL family acetyltransferase involved in cellulose biosynthesis [Azospirillum agricola]